MWIHASRYFQNLFSSWISRRKKEEGEGGPWGCCRHSVVCLFEVWMDLGMSWTFSHISFAFLIVGSRQECQKYFLSMSITQEAWIHAGTTWRSGTRFWKELRLRLQLVLSNTSKKRGVVSWDTGIITMHKFKIYAVIQFNAIKAGKSKNPEVRFYCLPKISCTSCQHLYF